MSSSKADGLPAQELDMAYLKSLGLDQKVEEWRTLCIEAEGEMAARN